MTQAVIVLCLYVAIKVNNNDCHHNSFHTQYKQTTNVNFVVYGVHSGELGHFDIKILSI